MTLGYILVYIAYGKHECNFFNFLRKEKYQNIPFLLFESVAAFFTGTVMRMSNDNLKFSIVFPCKDPVWK